jgi:hypothetical protein
VFFVSALVAGGAAVLTLVTRMPETAAD